jgi:hypothetical protein
MGSKHFVLKLYCAQLLPRPCNRARHLAAVHESACGTDRRFISARRMT